MVPRVVLVEVRPRGARGTRTVTSGQRWGGWGTWGLAGHAATGTLARGSWRLLVSLSQGRSFQWEMSQAWEVSERGNQRGQPEICFYCYEQIKRKKGKVSHLENT